MNNIGCFNRKNRSLRIAAGSEPQNPLAITDPLEDVQRVTSLRLPEIGHLVLVAGPRACGKSRLMRQPDRFLPALPPHPDLDFLRDQRVRHRAILSKRPFPASGLERLVLHVDIYSCVHFKYVRSGNDDLDAFLHTNPFLTWEPLWYYARAAERVSVVTLRVSPKQHARRWTQRSYRSQPSASTITFMSMVLGKEDHVRGRHEKIYRAWDDAVERLPPSSHFHLVSTGRRYMPAAVEAFG